MWRQGQRFNNFPKIAQLGRVKDRTGMRSVRLLNLRLFDPPATHGDLRELPYGAPPEQLTEF